MVHVVDLEVRVLLVDQLAERRPLSSSAIVGDRREAGRQRGERLERGLRPRELLVVEREACRPRGSTGHEAPVEPALLDRTRGALLALGPSASTSSRVMPSSVAIASAHTPWCDCGWISRGGARCRRPSASDRSRGLLRQRHHLGAAADDEVLRARHDHGRRDVVAGDAASRRTGRGSRRWRARRSRRRARPCARGRRSARDLRAGAPDDVVDVGGVEAVALGERLAAPCAPSCCGCRCPRARPCRPCRCPRGVRQASMMSASAMTCVPSRCFSPGKDQS